MMSDITVWLNNKSLNVWKKGEDFNNKDRIHDWKNYVPDELALSCNDLTVREKNIIKILCDDFAKREEWEL